MARGSFGQDVLVVVGALYRNVRSRRTKTKTTTKDVVIFFSVADGRLPARASQSVESLE